MGTYDDYRARYETDYVPTPKDRKQSSEQEERENKFKAAVEKLFQKLRLR
jgi:hypothetical protein